MNAASALLPLVLFGAAACTKADVPIEPAWGKQACDECGMLLSDRGFGAQLTNDGDRYFFDDVGCMAIFAERRKMPLLHAWVHAADSGQWIDAQTARYVDGVASPMNYGFEARGTGSLAWADVQASTLAGKGKP
jgi:hypothetical protein